MSVLMQSYVTEICPKTVQGAENCPVNFLVQSANEGFPSHNTSQKKLWEPIFQVLCPKKWNNFYGLVYWILTLSVTLLMATSLYDASVTAIQAGCKNRKRFRTGAIVNAKCFEFWCLAPTAVTGILYNDGTTNDMAHKESIWHGIWRTAICASVHHIILVLALRNC